MMAEVAGPAGNANAGGSGCQHRARKSPITNLMAAPAVE